MISFFIFTLISLVVSLLILRYKFSKGPKVGKLLIYLHLPLVLVNFIFFVILVLGTYRRTVLFFPGLFVLLTGAFIFVCGITKIKEGAIIPRKQLVKKGIYAYMKHPIYNGIVLGAFGTALLSSSLFAIIYSFILAAMLFIVAKKEEKELSERFGKKYRDYKLKKIL